MFRMSIKGRSTSFAESPFVLGSPLCSSMNRYIFRGSPIGLRVTVIVAFLLGLLLYYGAFFQRVQYAARSGYHFLVRLQAARDLYVGLARDAGLDLYEFGFVAVQNIYALDRFWL